MARPRKPIPDAGFISRLRELTAKLGSQATFAKRAGLAPTTLQNYLEGGEPMRPALIALAQAGGVSIEWLCSGRGSKSPDHLPEGYRAVPFFDLRPSEWRIYALSAGEPSDWILLKEVWVHGPGVEMGKLVSIEAPEAFEPDIAPGDLLVIDSARGWSPWRKIKPPTIVEGAICLVAREARISLRRLFWRERGRSILAARAGSQKREEISTGDPSFQPIGPVIWRAGSPSVLP